MRSPWLAAAVLVALGAAAYAFYTLTAREPSAASSVQPADASRGERRVGPVGDGGVRPTSAPSPATARSGDATEPGSPAEDAAEDGVVENARSGGDPPRIEPEVSLSQARADFDAVLRELDAIAAADEPLGNEAWVDLYKRGNDALLPLQQHLDWKVPAEAEELRSAQVSLRQKLHAVAPGGPAPREAAPSDGG